MLLGQVVTNIYPIIPCPLPLAPLYLTVTDFEQEATGHHAKPREAEILCREGLVPSVGLIWIKKTQLIYIKSSLIEIILFYNTDIRYL